MATELCFLQVKAFGDLVIAHAATTRVIEAQRPQLTLAIGDHLVPLCEALDPDVKVVRLAIAEAGVPAVFDVRLHGALAAARSAWRVRRAIKRAPIARSALLALDRLGARERFILGGRRAVRMPTETINIYEGYDRLLRNAGFDILHWAGPKSAAARPIGIFPGSRIAAKNVPAPLIADIMHTAQTQGLQVNLFLLDGERPDLEASALPHTILPRRFSALREAIALSSGVLSADSLPAHFAESLGHPVFVLTPRPNEFWMPRSVFLGRRWCLFDDPHRVRKVLAALEADIV